MYSRPVYQFDQGVSRLVNDDILGLSPIPAVWLSIQCLTNVYQSLFPSILSCVFIVQSGFTT